MEVVIQFVSEHLAAVIAAVLAVIAGGLVIRFRSHRQSGRSNSVDQRNAKAGGDVVGRDKITRIND
jgi:hypothetical protein